MGTYLAPSKALSAPSMPGKDTTKTKDLNSQTSNPYADCEKKLDLLLAEHMKRKMPCSVDNLGECKDLAIV